MVLFASLSIITNYYLPLSGALCVYRMLRRLWSYLTFKFLTEFINNKVDLLLSRKKLKQATFIFSLGTLLKLFLVFYAVYFIVNNSQEESVFIYYITLVEEFVAIVLCCIILFSNYLKLKKRSVLLGNIDT